MIIERNGLELTASHTKHGIFHIVSYRTVVIVHAYYCFKLKWPSEMYMWLVICKWMCGHIVHCYC